MNEPKSERQKIVERSRDMLHSDPAKQALAREGWQRVVTAIDEWAEAKRPRPKSFEVHHMEETAREAFLTGIVEGKSLEECERLARIRIGL